MRTYLVVIDESPESRVALRFAARRAAKTAGTVALLALVPRPEFVQWGAVQAAMEEEERLRVEALVHEVAGSTLEELGVRPEIMLRHGDPVTAVHETLAALPDVAALVLGASAEPGGPGPLVEHFAGPEMSRLPCPLMLIPGGLDEAALDRLS